MKGEVWPEGISNGLILRCAICRKQSAFDYKVHDHIWRLVVPKKHRLGVICLSCFDRLCQNTNINLANYLLEVQFCGIGKTIILEPTKTYIHPSFRVVEEKRRRK